MKEPTHLSPLCWEENVRRSHFPREIPPPPTFYLPLLFSSHYHSPSLPRSHLLSQSLSLPFRWLYPLFPFSHSLIITFSHCPLPSTFWVHLVQLFVFFALSAKITRISYQVYFGQAMPYGKNKHFYGSPDCISFIIHTNTWKSAVTFVTVHLFGFCIIRKHR